LALALLSRAIAVMKETTGAAMPPCFDRWCKKFDNLLRTKAQKREFRHYLGGLLGESERKNVFQMARDAVEVTYHKLHHFLTEATWSAEKINERRERGDESMQPN
jgi:SRSO17 transposase